jgi:Arc/MetJ-type ribon-helix-helix transcriptional regulator
MTKSIAVKPKKRGRPATGKDPLVGIRIAPELTAKIDEWAQRNAFESRSEAIRHMIELVLAGSGPPKQTSPKAAAKASDMAAHQIDKLANPGMPEQERRARKRRLLKGPREFRDLRSDQPKPKG